MSDWNFIDGMAGMQPITENSDTQKHLVGLEACAYHATYGMGKFIYLPGVASTAAADWVSYDLYDGATTRLVANARGNIGVAMSACVAGEYGWYQIEGAAVAEVLASFAAGAICYATATAGHIDDAEVEGDKIDGAISTTAIDTPATGQAVVLLNRPFMSGGDALT